MTDEKKILVTALGDSITSGAPLWDPNPDVRATLGPGVLEQSQWPYWAAQADPRVVFRNCGINMQETGEIAARLDESVEEADALIVQGGINDLVHDKPLEGAAENLEIMLERGRSLGLRVAVAELIPNNNFPHLDEPIQELNRRIGEIAAAQGVIVLPFYETLEDPGLPHRIGAAWTDDGNHPSVEGHRRLGELAFTLP